jgi:DNA polymerase III delta subunit
LLFVILGSDRALAKRALDRQLSELDPTGMDTDRIDAAGSSFDALYAAVTAAPFFGNQRVIVLTGLLAQAASKGGRGTKAKSDSDISRLTAALPETTHLVLFDPDLAELSATLKKQLPDGVGISANEAPRGTALVELARRMAEENGSSLDSATARVILDRLFPAYWPQAPMNRAYDKPPSVEQLESEIAKLALASYPGPITAGIAMEMIPQRSEERIFPLLDAVIGGNQRAALIETENAWRAGEDAGRSMSQLYQQIELAVAAKSHGRPTDPQQAGRALGLANANRMRPVEQAAQRARVAPARQLALALEGDRKLKTGRIRNPDEGLVDLVVRVTGQTENR